MLGFDPFNPLQLGVHHEGPALAAGEDGGVLGGHAVGRQALVLPSRYVGVVRQHGQRVEGWSDRDRHLGGEEERSSVCQQKAASATYNIF